MDQPSPLGSSGSEVSHLKSTYQIPLILPLGSQSQKYSLGLDRKHLQTQTLEYDKFSFTQLFLQFT